ncbi:MAG: pyridoxine 5'-phosphate synthase [Vicingaceae bacterium]|jgi:pyridoxine 5-phosphate synthase|tara:strand:- start:1252 stop:1965 length:714 start_codon:yes stop_codon:yes gene_type:complete
MSRLSVNINKIATLRNARGEDVPNLIKVALDCEKFGAQGITIHPRPDERHIRYKDVYDLKKVITTEFNIEGYPNRKFIDLVLEVKPEQVTLVPDPPEVLTSNAGWKVTEKKDFLNNVLQEFKSAGIRTSIFMETDMEQINFLPNINTDRIEFYTGPYAANYKANPAEAIKEYVTASKQVAKFAIGINAGHDLDSENLAYFKQHITNLEEVSIGHALICDALNWGLEKTIQTYLKAMS